MNDPENIHKDNSVNDLDIPELNIQQFGLPDEVDIESIQLSYEEKLEIERRKAGQRVAVVVLLIMMIMIPLFAMI